jgi:hypothetical protein
LHHVERLEQEEALLALAQLGCTGQSAAATAAAAAAGAGHVGCCAAYLCTSELTGGQRNFPPHC